MLKKTLTAVLIVLALILAAAGALVIWLTVTEFSPESVENADLVDMDGGAVSHDGVLKVISFNTGYAVLGEESEFFMDGGREVRPDSRAVIDKNCEGILSILAREDADFYLLQEVDLDSKRSYGINEAAKYAETLALSSAYAQNYSCEYVPFPLPTIGKVHSGLQTLSSYGIASAERIALPCPFSWPVSTANLKRCLLVSRFDIVGSDKQLVIVNLHLEAYDDGEGKLEQTKVLSEFVESEYAAGNYVIAGGDFNQSFEGSRETYPIADPEKWTPGMLDDSMIPEGWSYAYDSSCATCRLLDAPLSEKSQLYVIDGFILSPNIEPVSVRTLDEGFRFSDHNPVVLEFMFK